MTRARVLLLAWAPTAGRARDLAVALDGTARTVYPQALSNRRLVPVRYAASAVLTVGELIRSRPRSIVVQNPPVYPALIAAAYARLVRARFVLDNHPTSFGAKGNRQAQRMMRVTRRLSRRAEATLVTTPGWAAVVEEWGGRPIVLHEAPPHWEVGEPRPQLAGRPRILFAGVFADDEPVADVIGAAALLPDMDIVITGDPRRAPAGLLDDLPVNVSLTGWLDQEAYAREVDRCDILLALTDEPSSVMRAAYEAGYARRVLVLSATDVLTELFPEAVHTGHGIDVLAASLRQAVERYAELAETLEVVRERQRRRWVDQEMALLEALGLGPAGPAGPAPTQPAAAGAMPVGTEVL